MTDRNVEVTPDKGHWQTLVAIGVMALIGSGAWYLIHNPTPTPGWPLVTGIGGAFLILLGTIVYAGQSHPN